MYSVGSVQLAWFTTATPSVPADEIYRMGCEVDPDQVQRNKVLSVQNPLLGLAAGSEGRFHCEVQVQPGRVDLIGTPIIDEFPLQGPLPTLDLDFVLDYFLPCAQRVSAVLDHCYRVATILTLLEPHSAYVDGAKSIFADIGTDFDPTGLSDVMFQVNKRRAIRDGIEMNRLIRFSMMERGAMAVSGPDGRANHQGYVSQPVPERAVAFDLNTVPTGVTYTLDQSQALFEDLFDELSSLIGTSTFVAGLHR